MASFAITLESSVSVKSLVKETSYYSGNVDYDKTYAIGYFTISNDNEDLPEFLLEGPGRWETNVFHGKCLAHYIDPITVEQYWATKGKVLQDEVHFRISQSDWYDREFKYYWNGKMFVKSVEYIAAPKKFPIPDPYPVVDNWLTVDTYDLDWKFTSDTKGTYYTDHTQYKYFKSKDTIITRNRTSYSLGGYSAPKLEKGPLLDLSQATHFGEETMNTSPPETEMEPYVGHGRPPMYYASGSKSFMSHAGLQEAINKAYYQAISNVGKANDNNIQNVQAAVEMLACLGKIINACRTGNFKSLLADLPQDWRDWWLWYRYQYNTTKMDAEEICGFLKKKLQALPHAYRNYYGRETFNYAGDLVTVNCRLLMREGPANGPLEAINKAIWQWGFEPNLYVLWDSLPFSFMVDWKLPMGDVLQVLSNKDNYEAYADIRNVCFSIKYQHKYPNSMWEYYTRFHTRPLAIDESYWFSKGNTSHTTAVKRILDAVSIFTKR